MYDYSRLAKTLDKYIDYKKLNLAATQEELPSVSRLIITAVDVMTGKPLVFDNTRMEIKANIFWQVLVILFMDFLGLKLKIMYMDGMVVC